jgi:hypothetical protein
MQEREDIVAELWSRLAAVDGVMFTARNPKAEPKVENMPCIQFWEMADVVEESTKRGDYPAYKRALRVVVESFVKSTEEAKTSQDLKDFIVKVKQQIYRDGASLGRRCNVTEIESSRVLRPPVGENVIGLGIVFELRYIETTSKLFA